MKIKVVLIAVLYATFLNAAAFAQSDAIKAGEVVTVGSTEYKTVLGKLQTVQSSRTDGGVIIVEETNLGSTKRSVVFMATQDISQDAYVAFQIIASEGQQHQYQMLHFPTGLRRGQTISLWNGEFSLFQTTPWLRMDVTVLAGNDAYYAMAHMPVNYLEQYKEPLIASISETKIAQDDYLITARGIFDTTEPSLIVLNNNIAISAKAITQTPPGIIQFRTTGIPAAQFPPGKYLLTICQAGHCDTLQGRHR